MSCCGKPSEGGKVSDDIDKQLREDKKKLASEVKLLLLGDTGFEFVNLIGAGESGKSTIAKQMKMIYKEGFTAEERATYKSIVYHNLISAMRTLVTAASDLKIELGSEVKGAAERLLANGEEYFNGPLSSTVVKDIKDLWSDAGIKETFANSSKFQLIDSAQYYFDNIDRIGDSNYSPSEQDVLRSRAKTTGIIEIEFIVSDTRFRMVDVGGQRSERKKWMHCFQDVTSVIFCVALSEYDLKLQEDDTTNRMQESLKLFKEICNSKWFTDTSMILFLNKKDLFAEKIQKVDLNVCFEDYTGGKDYKKASDFIKDKFLAQNENSNKIVYPHLTCATDTDNVSVVFRAVRDIIVRKMLGNEGIM